MELSSNSHEIIQFSTKTRIQLRMLEITCHIIWAYLVAFGRFLAFGPSDTSPTRMWPLRLFVLVAFLFILFWYDSTGRKKIILSRLKAEFPDLPQPAEKILAAMEIAKRSSSGVGGANNVGSNLTAGSIILLQFVSIALFAICVWIGFSHEISVWFGGGLAGLIVGFWLSRPSIRAIEESLTRQLQRLESPETDPPFNEFMPWY